MTRPRIIVLGAGIAGVAAAYYANRNGHEVLVFEASSRPGGNARTETFGEFRYDSGAHRFHDKIPSVTADLQSLLGSSLREVDSPSRNLNRGHFYRFPLEARDLLSGLDFATLLRSGGELFAQRVSQFAKGLKPTLRREDFRLTKTESLRESVTQRFGTSLAQRFVLDYSEKLWGHPAHSLSSEVSGGRLDGLSVRGLLSDLTGRRSTEHLEGRFLYPDHGFGTIVGAMLETLPRGAVHCNSRCVRLDCEKERVKTLQVETQSGRTTIDVGSDRVISTLPLPALLGISAGLERSASLTAAQDLRFRDLVLLGLVLEQTCLSENASVYFSDPELPFTRLHEPKNRSAKMAPSDRTLVLLEFPCSRDDAIWKTDADALTDQTVDQLAKLGVVNPENVSNHFVSHCRNAYPVLLSAQDELRVQARELIAKVENLEILGRTAEFAYLHTHDILARAKTLTR